MQKRLNLLHVWDSSLVELVNDKPGWDTDSRDEQAGLLLDNDIDQVVELSLGVVVVGLSGIATNLGQ